MKPRVIVNLKMKPYGDPNSRACPFIEGYRQYFLPRGSDIQLAVTATQCPGEVGPGDEAEVEFEFDYPTRVDYGPLVVGAEFELMEGRKAVATGTVLRRNDDVP